MAYTIDFETNNHKDDCHIWVWGICKIETLEFTYGVDWESLINFWTKNPDTYYFHNLKFDGEFIISYLLNHNYTHVLKSPDVNEFTTLISNKGVFYSMQIGLQTKRGRKVKIQIQDSLKLINSSVEKIAKDFKLPILKGKIDYNLYRPVDYTPTPEEISYLKNDVEIMARALNIFFKMSANKMTIASNAMHDYINIIGKNNFSKLFPKLPYYIDKDIRQAYRGGWTYLKKGYSGKMVGKGRVYDVNGLYYYVMKTGTFPIGEPMFFNGKYKYDPIYKLHIQMFTCQFELKDGYLPTIQLKHHLNFMPTEYVESSKGEDVTLCLTNYDIEIFYKHYNVYNEVYHSGWKFRYRTGIFNAYVDKWVNVKVTAEKEGNGAERAVAKMFLTNLYGKFGKNPLVASKIPYLDKSGVVKYYQTDFEIKESIYIPLALFVTSESRYITISAAQQNYKRFIYADTDSLHLEGTEEPIGIKVDKYELGAWKNEGNFLRAKFLRAKCYMEELDNGEGNEPSLKVTCAGLPKGILKIETEDGPRPIKESDNIITFDNFNFGLKVEGGLKARRVKGGIILVDSPFTVKQG